MMHCWLCGKFWNTGDGFNGTTIDSKQAKKIVRMGSNKPIAELEEAIHRKKEDVCYCNKHLENPKPHAIIVIISMSSVI